MREEERENERNRYDTGEVIGAKMNKTRGEREIEKVYEGAC